MGLKRAWFAILAVVCAFVFAAGTAQATTYVRGYVRPSGDGLGCGGNSETCVQIDSSGTAQFTVDAYGVVSTPTISFDVISYCCTIITSPNRAF